MKSVDPSFYNRQYFQGRYQELDYGKLKKLSDFDHIYQKTGSLLKLNKEDRVVDLGCGIGQLSLYLYLKYGCDVTEIDYSKDAIEICSSNINALKKEIGFENIENKIHFLLSNNENIPFFSSIKAVFMVDVIEHLYDQEIDLVLEKIKEWSGNGGIYLVIHTDNNNYLKFIRPITNFISVAMGKTTYERIKYGKEIVMKGHINLTTTRKIRKKLKIGGFETIRLEYPDIDLEITSNQLGDIGKYKIILYPIYFFGRILFFLRPSFYLLARYEAEKRQ